MRKSGKDTEKHRFKGNGQPCGDGVCLIWVSHNCSNGKWKLDFGSLYRLGWGFASRYDEIIQRRGNRYANCSLRRRH